MARTKRFPVKIVVDGILHQQCTWCDEYQPYDLEHFPPYNARSPKGVYLRSYCRECHREYNREYMTNYRAEGRITPASALRIKIGQILWNVNRKLKTMEKKGKEIEASIKLANQLNKQLEKMKKAA